VNEKFVESWCGRDPHLVGNKTRIKGKPKRGRK